MAWGMRARKGGVLAWVKGLSYLCLPAFGCCWAGGRDNEEVSTWKAPCGHRRRESISAITTRCQGRRVQNDVPWPLGNERELVSRGELLRLQRPSPYHSRFVRLRLLVPALPNPQTLESATFYVDLDLIQGPSPIPTAFPA